MTDRETVSQARALLSPFLSNPTRSSKFYLPSPSVIVLHLAASPPCLDSGSTTPAILSTASGASGPSLLTPEAHVGRCLASHMEVEVLQSPYAVRDSIADYEADLRCELHEETPDSELFLEDLAGDVLDVLKVLEDIDAPEDSTGKTKKKRPRRSKSSLGKKAGGSKQALGAAQELETPRIKWMRKVASKAQQAPPPSNGASDSQPLSVNLPNGNSAESPPRRRRRKKRPAKSAPADPANLLASGLENVSQHPPGQTPTSAPPYPDSAPSSSSPSSPPSSSSPSSPPSLPSPDSSPSAPLSSLAPSPEPPANAGRKNSHRGGKRLQEARKYTTDPRGQKLYLLRQRILQRGELHRSDTFSMVHDSSHSSTGWSGLRHNPAWRAEVRKAMATPASEMWHRHLPEFTLLPFTKGCTVPLILLDCEDRMVVVRGPPCLFLSSAEKDELVMAFQKLLHSTLSDPKVRLDCANGERGDHFGGIMGEHRPYGTVPTITQWHKDHLAECEELFRLKVFQSFIGWISWLVELFFPKVAARYKACIRWNEKRHKVKARFGLFFQLCINGYFPGQKRVHCTPHSDSKNIIGVCVVVAFVLPGYDFDHTRYTWLVVWEMGVIVELPPWVPLLYPSCLFHHFNVDIDQIRVVQTSGRVQPTRENSTDITNGTDQSSGRGSLVFFNQASLFQSSETNSDSLKEARRQGKVTTLDYPEVADRLFK